jgi:peptide/nickel transport system permease protein
MPATLELVAVAALLALAMGIPLGVLTALRRNSIDSQAVMTFSLAGVAMPTFVIGILLIYVFSVECKTWAPSVGLPGDWCFPSFGRGETEKIGGWTTGLLTASGLKAIVLPAFTLSLFQMTLVLRLVRSQMLEVLRTDYIKFARARGLTNRAVHFRHALKNTLLPVITVIGIQVGGLIAFSIITETVFQWPGMGQLFIQSVQFADIPVMAAYLVMVSLIFVIINFFVDLLYAAIDPRLRLDRARVGTAGG